MDNKHFTHLHLHSDFSLLDGAISLDRLINWGKTNKSKALAITDHGNIFGAVKFFEKCKKAGIKPILGMEAYLTDDIAIKQVDKKYWHVILLVKSEQGYKNLCKLISFSYQQGFYFKPRIDYEQLARYSEGLVATTACLGGHIPQLLMADQTDQAEERMAWFVNTFGQENFYFEIQPEDQKDQTILNRKLYEWSAKKNIPLLATGDCHYVAQDDHEAHEIMLSIQTHDKISNPDRYTFGDCRVYMRTQDEMLTQFAHHEEAIWNSGKIADACSFDFQTGKLFFPKFEMPPEFTQDTYFRHLCNLGFEKLIADQRFPIERKEHYQQRLDLEIDLILKMGFVGYFLVVSDFIQWARNNNIPVGPGRGSAAGSLVAWSLQITDVDPIQYNLLFERFLNPERITMPDIDIDFCIEGRDRVINYIRDKYGHDKVCQIITFGTMMAKGVIKDVARVLGFSFEDSNAITNLIPDTLKITLSESVEQEPRLKELITNNPKAKKLFDIALKLEGLTRHASKHAAGIVISPDPIDEVLPVTVPNKGTELVTQYAMTELESLGFLKIDLLGLKNLTLIANSIELIKQNHGVTIDFNKVPLDDPNTFVLLGKGLTSGVFQLESDGLKEVLRKLQPEKFEDIIAVNALYRPGPLGSGMVEDFIERKHGRQKISYLFAELEPILNETYGVIVYQEQVMKIATAIGGYSLGESDILRRAMGKKKAEEMAKQQAIFVSRATERGFDSAKAKELFDLMAYFAGYGFNKSHSAAYALIAYQTAYLKANYLSDFMACLISLEADAAEQMSFYLQEAKDMGLTICPPDINRSLVNFSVESGALLFGLRGIKNVGMAALENIITERAKNPFKDLFDFCKRIDLRTSNKRVIEHLICAGAFDGLPGNRRQKYEQLEAVMEQAITQKKNEATGQMGLFGMVQENTESSSASYELASTPEWTDKEKLEKEKEVVGFYLSAHPLETYRSYLQWFAIKPFDQLLKEGLAMVATNSEIRVTAGGLIKSRKDIITKKGDRMTFLQFEDGASAAEVIIFPKLFATIEQWLDQYHVFLIKGSLDLTSTGKCKIKAENCIPFEEIFHQTSLIQQVRCTLLHPPSEQYLESASQSITPGTVPLEFIFNEQGKKIRLKTKRPMVVTQEIIKTLESGNASVQLVI